jgi:5'(3')-deoxyribonucleotidase
MDEVMADTLGEHLRRYNERFDAAIALADIEDKGLWGAVSEDRFDDLRDLIHAEDFFEDLDVMPGAQEVLLDLHQRFEIFIATQAMSVPNSFGPKFRWLQRHFPFLPPSRYVFCGNKSILLADYLIDDTPRNLELFRGSGLLYDAPHNRSAQGFTRVNNWQEVAAYFESLAEDGKTR